VLSYKRLELKRKCDATFSSTQYSTFSLAFLEALLPSEQKSFAERPKHTHTHTHTHTKFVTQILPLKHWIIRQKNYASLNEPPASTSFAFY